MAFWHNVDAGTETTSVTADNNCEEARPCVGYIRARADHRRETLVVVYQRKPKMAEGPWRIGLRWGYGGDCSITTWDKCNAPEDIFRVGSVEWLPGYRMVEPNIWGPDNDSLFLVFRVLSHGSTAGVPFFAATTDAGRTWSPRVQLGGTNSNDASVCGYGRDAFAVYKRRAGAQKAIRLAHVKWFPGLVVGPAGTGTARLLQAGGSVKASLFRAAATGDFVTVDRSFDNGESWDNAGAPGWGGRPALAEDDDTLPCIAFANACTLFCSFWTEEDEFWADPETVFVGTEDEVVGQPSVALYPGKSDGVKVAALSWVVYDEQGNESRLMFAKCDTGRVVLDTIEVAANLADSFPCINIANSDSVYVTFQKGDSVVSSELKDYGPGNWNRPPAWSSLKLITADGHAPMSVLEGDALHCVWTRRVTPLGAADTFHICHATYDPTSMFQDWTAGANPSNSAPPTAEKSSSVYAGCGVTCWLEQVDGIWVVKARVRDSVVTLASAPDTNLASPHVLAESSATTPSIDQVRVKLYYMKVVVESGDTCGIPSFETDSFSASNAGPGATRANNGTKLVQKPGSDSLFAVYADASGGVYFAWSASGDSWKRAVLTENGREPAISRDGTGRLWTVYLDAAEQEVVARYRVGDTWSTVKTLYPVEPGENNVSGISLAGSPDDENSCAYAAFRYTNSGSSRFIIAAKFNANSLRVDTVADGEVNDPCIAVENSGGNGDWLHLAYESNGNVVYTMTQDDWAADDWQGFPDWEQEVMLFESGQQTARHPCLVANADKLVIACAEGATPDVFVRERATGDDHDDWAEAVNLSNTEPHGSDYPVVFLGDSIAVVWEEARSEEDHDILASINYGETVTLVNNPTTTSYPHVVLQTRTSPEPAVILHLVTSQSPKIDYYEVGYGQFNLAEMGGGQQSASTTPARIQPELFPAQPNPFNRATSIRYQTAQTGHVLLRVYDASGRVVSTLENSTRKPGRYTATWDGTDTRGHKMANGIYFYRLDVPGFRSVKKAVLMR